jgi:putative aldouronate transport system permease protein
MLRQQLITIMIKRKRQERPCPCLFRKITWLAGKGYLLLFSKKEKRNFSLHLMLLPGVLLVLIFSYLPMFGLIMAFQNYVPVKGFFGSKWVGFHQFEYMIHLPHIFGVVWNTIYIATLKIIIGLIIPIILSLLLNEIVKQKFKRSIQTLVYMPHFLSWIILAGILYDILSQEGIVNQLLKVFNIKPIFFLGDNRFFPYVLVATELWKNAGFSTIIFLAALTSIDPSLYEASSIDGANRWRQTLNITLPGMIPIIILVATLSLGSVLDAGFEQVFTLYNPTVYQSGDILDTYVYRLGLVDARYSLATAVGLFKSFVSMFLVGFSYYLAYKKANYRIF